jgi:cyclic beta-1,2-glucan synthetase
MNDFFADPVTSQGWEAGQNWPPGPRQTRPRPVPVWHDLDRVGSWLDQAVKAASAAEPVASSAAEWLLDNAYIVERALVLLKQDLPQGFYARLRPLASGPAPGEPRILMLAHGLLAATGHQVSREGVFAYLAGYQSHHPLDIAELWALPAVLRLACLERLTMGFAGAFPKVAPPFAASRSARHIAPPEEPQECVGRAIANFAVISTIDWKEVFDHCSAVDHLLRADPAQTYARCDFGTRDTYRRSLEQLADLGSCSQLEVAQAALDLAERSDRPRDRHVGFWLTDKGLPELETTLGVRVPSGRRLGRLLLRHPGMVYAALLFVCGLAGLAIPLAYMLGQQASLLQLLVGLALAALPTTVLAVTLVNWLITLTVPPRLLPRLDFSEGIDPEARTVVIVPVILGSIAEAEAILETLELHRLANPEAQGFVLLSDPVDADQHTLPGDAAIEQALRAGIVALNRKWDGGFCLMHRERGYNPAQGCWMAWERKRGKIEQFNQFLLTGERSVFPVVEGNVQRLVGAPLVVTADGDTRLPPGSVARLAGTLAHPLNRPEFGSKGRITAGYTILQPRVEIGPYGIATRFARLFGGDSAIDIYSRAVSDVWQDLTGTGNFVGKGIYDVAGFNRSLEGRIPENLLLSHDLWEGLHGRAALVSDIIVYEGFPASYAEYARRWHRWVRGDWQLLPWLLGRVPGPGHQRLANRLTMFERLRIWDNMRRSLIPPSVLGLLLAGWFVLPGSPLVWTAIALLVPGAWLFTDVVTGMARGRRRGVLISARQQTREHLQRWAMQVAFLPVDSAVALHAVLLTLLRLRSGQHLLEWTSAAQVNRLLDRGSLRSVQWAAAWPAPVTMVILAALLPVFAPGALIAAIPLLAAWLAAPEIARWSALPDQRPIAALSQAQCRYLRLIARRSWLFFERFAGPGDHWLVPDNHQEAPVAATAHRTSPTNIGMMALSALSAWRLGHLGSPEFALRMRLMLDALDRLEKWHGHLLNWYDTTSLASLEPRYVSTVDSGNLAGSLVVLAQGCREIARLPAFVEERWRGFADCLDLLESALAQSGLDPALSEQPARLRAEVTEGRADPSAWGALLDKAEGQLGDLRRAIIAALAQTDTIDAVAVEPVHDWLERCEHHIAQSREELAQGLNHPTAAHTAQLEAIADRAAAMAEAMDFRPLYDPHRRLFHIGYDLGGERHDPHLYDLLASEARLASFFAIARRDVPPDHWFQLGRPVVRQRGQTVLVSWNGSMFEYLMSALFMRSQPATLLGMTESEVVTIQQAYGVRHQVPWGISESGFAAHGPDGIWRYHAFGVPAIGLRRGLDEDLVIAPYASALALPFDPPGVIANLHRLEALGALGRFGFHEAIDFTPARLGEGGDPSTVRSYMAHHHGMTIGAIANALADDLLVRWFGSDRQMRSVDLLLHERIPWEIPPERERMQRLPAQTQTAAPRPRARAWEHADKPRSLLHLIGNGQLTLGLSTDGCGDLVWKGHCITVPAGRDRAEGHFLYLRDAHDPDARALLPEALTERRAIIHPHKLELRGNFGPLAAILDVLVAPNDDVEIRRLRLINPGNAPRELEFASHADLALAHAGEWHRHPAFARLFVEAALHPASQSLIFTRRPRERNAQGLAMAQRIIGTEGLVQLTTHDVSRRRTRGRTGSHHRFPHFPGTAGATEQFPLDAAAAMLARIALPARSEVEIAVVTALAPRAEEAVETLSRYGSLAALDWTERDASERLRTHLARSGLPPERLDEAQRLHSALVSVPRPRVAEENSGSRSDLWALGISGDLPILLYAPEAEFPGEDLRFLLCAHRLWRWLGARIDLVVLYPGLAGYVEPIRERILAAIRDCECEDLLGQPGGIALIGREHAERQRIAALERAARVTLRGPLVDLCAQIAAEDAPAVPVPALVPTAPPPDIAPAAPAGGPDGFTDAGSYRIRLAPGESTPAPWANVIANPVFGSIVSEAGLGFSFCENSGEYRLTPWHNDPLRDPPAEALWLRDEITGTIWSATPRPAGQGCGWAIEHRPGSSLWRTCTPGLEQELRCFVDKDDAVKIMRLKLRETAGTPRRLTATFLADLLIGVHRGEPAPFRNSHYHPGFGAIIARNPDQAEYRRGLVFLASSAKVHSLSTSRRDVLGTVPDWQRPAGLVALGLGDRTGNAGEDAVAALQGHLDLAPGEEVDISFFLGAVAEEQELAALLARLREPDGPTALENRLQECWDERHGVLQVSTPDPAFDAMVNHWLGHQNLSSRLFARAGYYQASGAYGFRDQLQDVTALLLSAPELAREHILRAAAQQFKEGDVLHWWHPPSGKGVRTRCSDDLLWLPFVVAEYVAATGDAAILDEDIPFLDAPELARDEADRYGVFASGPSASLHVHCLRAFERAHRLGSHGLPLIGDGDWNDGMNRIGSGGRGESVWLAWFMAVTIRAFARIGPQAARRQFVQDWLPRATQLVAAAETEGWDGAWYLRAFDDFGRPWGSAGNEECQIDTLVQAWAVMAEADPARIGIAIDSAFAHLVRPEDSIVRLLDPPFADSPRDPGYIMAYPPGIRENGGQYSHAAAWLGIACARLGDGARAKAVFDRINPACHAATPEDRAAYATEPYAVAGDISGGNIHLGRGGWTWYTGAAGWAYRLATEHILGIRLDAGRIVLAPCLPPDWEGYTARLEGDGTIAIEVGRAESGGFFIDGKPALPQPVAFPGKGRTTRIRLALGQDAVSVGFPITPIPPAL